MKKLEIKGTDGIGVLEINQYGGPDDKDFIEIGWTQSDWKQLSTEDVEDIINKLKELLK